MLLEESKAFIRLYLFGLEQTENIECIYNITLN